ncbi:protein FAM161A-like [Xyrauchen texanus]|uniref:protein FAM161A-like n=1 Tax=Xyrauchen texanus TaxID=154827 RepID=UPI002241AF98|nr:protein FAM161A-like [Xyrauchen texanus]
MDKCHRNNVLVTSCLKTPVDPQTKTPLAQYERERSLPRALAELVHDTDYEKEMEYDSGSDSGADDSPAKDGNPLLIKDYRMMGDHIDLREFYFSNQEYYHKLEQLKRAHLQTMAELERMYRKKLELNGVTAAENTDQINRSQQERSSPMLTGGLKKAQSSLELRHASDLSDVSDEDPIVDKEQGDRSNYNSEIGLLLSPKEHIKNMWQDFNVKKLSPPQRHLCSSSLQSLTEDCQKTAAKPKGRVKRQRLKQRKKPGVEGWHLRMTVPEPFQMTLREAERRKKGIKSRSQIEQENADLRRQLEELTECQRKFRASPVPAHIRLPLYEELQEREEERRRLHREMEQQHLHSSQRPFSFLERERLKKEQKEAKLREEMLKLTKEEEERRKCPFRSKPVPRAVKEAALGEQQKEEELYRAIKMQMRAKELLHSASMPPSMLARRLSERKAQKATEDDKQARGSHRPKINTEIPDFDASYRRFQKQLANRRDVRPVTACEPFQLCTANITSHKERIIADIEEETKSPRPLRWPFVIPPVLSPKTPSSSLCSSLSGSQEYLSSKITDAAKKRQEAVRKVLEQRKKAEEEEERWKEKQKQREKKLQKVISKRAQANDPHVALAQTCQSKLKEFRKQDLQRCREYQEEIRGIHERVKGRPLLLEQVAQMNAKRAAEKLYCATLHGCGLSESFIRSKAPKDLKNRKDTPSPSHSDSQTPPTYSKNRSEDTVEHANLQNPFHYDFPDDYEEYDHEQEGEHMDRDDDEKLNEYHNSDEERGDDEHSYDELDFDEAEQDDSVKGDDIISKSSKVSESNSSDSSNRSSSGSIGSEK